MVPRSSADDGVAPKGVEMRGPDDRLRGWVAVQMDAVESEEGLEEALGVIDEELANDLSSEPYGGQDPAAVLAAVEAWASVASYAAARFYAPSSPWPRGLSGWSRRAVGRLRTISNRMVPPLRAACATVQAKGFSVGVAFPWGVSVSLEW